MKAGANLQRVRQSLLALKVLRKIWNANWIFRECRAGLAFQTVFEMVLENETFQGIEFGRFISKHGHAISTFRKEDRLLC